MKRHLLPSKMSAKSLIILMTTITILGTAVLIWTHSAAPQHCVTSVQSVDEENNTPSGVAEMRCFDSPAEAIAYVTDGRS